MDVELAHNALAMSFHRAHADTEVVGNLLIAQAFGDLDEHFALTIG